MTLFLFSFGATFQSMYLKVTNSELGYFSILSNKLNKLHLTGFPFLYDLETRELGVNFEGESTQIS